ncbi:hypothetical protein DCC39_03930 [Pueribacillus theae]|uniref:Uncharacterized protein n=1 Tax=Pueribacillus theae TaxID=2171751 RepID=A0A2U1K762_9BACI|nr:hypothetical protein DCC39_03930 [Pueribacillus theae]
MISVENGVGSWLVKNSTLQNAGVYRNIRNFIAKCNRKNIELREQFAKYFICRRIRVIEKWKIGKKHGSL